MTGNKYRLSTIPKIRYCQHRYKYYRLLYHIKVHYFIMDIAFSSKKRNCTIHVISYKIGEIDINNIYITYINFSYR